MMILVMSALDKLCVHYLKPAYTTYTHRYPYILPVIIFRYLLLLLHVFIGFFSRTTWVSRYQKGNTSPDLNEAREGFGMAVASAGPYANNLHLTQTDNHTNTSSLNFYRPDALHDAQPQRQSTDVLMGD